MMINTSLAGSTSRLRTEEQLLTHNLDFSAAFMAVQYLAAQIEHHPSSITAQTSKALLHLIDSDQFSSQKQVLFLYSSAAEALVEIAKKPGPAGAQILPCLREILLSSSGKRLRAVGQALGRLPVDLKGAAPPVLKTPVPLKITLEDLLSQFKGHDPLSLKWQGRSLVVKTNSGIQDKTGKGKNKYGVGIIKFATSPANIPQLAEEILWMDHLNSHPVCSHTRFDIPSPIIIQGAPLFNLPGLPPELGRGTPFDAGGTAIAFHADAAYFDYPNEPLPGKCFCPEEIKEIFTRNARLLGRLSGKAIFHTALIPLFHNRVQQGRRNDNGAYLWEHGGRLDQWLDSCRYPNFADSGLRDFEHLIHSCNSGQLRHYIGEHLLSFILVIGSYFRNLAPHRRGKDENGPQDTRDLFDPALFKSLVRGVVQAYHKGLTGNTNSIQTDDLGLDLLIPELIDNMGVDENMEEILRIQDQQDMDQKAFMEFLRQRGIVSPVEKGKADLVLDTGPHLGGFSQPISVPALIDLLFRFSSLCVCDCYLLENRLRKTG